MAVTINGTTGVVVPNGSVSVPSLQGGSSTTGVYYGTNTVSISTSGVNAVTVDASQDVTLSGNLTLSGTSPSSNVTGSTSAFGNVISGAYTAQIVQYATGETYCQSNGTQFNLGTSSSAPILFKTNNTTKMTLDASGNLEIGATDGDSRLYVKSTSAGTVDFKVAFSPTDYFGISSQSDGYQLASVGGTNALRFATGGAERARIDSSGNFLIGVTSTGGGSGNQFRVFSNTAAKVAAEVYINAATSTATPALRVAKYDNNTTTSQVFVQFSINQFAAGSGQINANGASAAAFGTFSDRRLKENITSLPPQLDNILALKPSEFDYLDNGGHQIGFIAQEMQDVYPDVVGPGADGMLMITGWSKTEARLVSAIQEISAKLDAAEARIAALEAN